VLSWAVLVAAGLPARADEKKVPAAPRSRTFQFTYRATVTGLQAGETARVWLPVPPSNDVQTVSIVSRDLPGESRLGKEKKFGNQILYFEAKADAEGKVPFQIVYRVTRKEVKGEASKDMIEDAAQLAKFLQADARVPVGGKPLELIKGKELPMDQEKIARVLYDLVNGHVRYSKEGTGWGRGDSEWVCQSGYGNCTDFHSLFMSLARAKNIPAKFEIGFPLPEKRGAGEVPGYHCWAFFLPRGKGWVPVDISEANKNPKMKDYYFGNLTEDRVTFSTGRDLELTPKQEGEPLNFFVYPYVETAGKPVPQEKIMKKFAFRDEK
jgi:transglutaminase-like putative cysteine protease